MTTNPHELPLPRPGVPWGLAVLSVAAGVAMFAGAYLAFFYAPTERVMGFIQKIFYFHVPAAWMMLLAAPLMAVGAIGYLFTRRDPWDRVADAAVELAILFGALVLITGPLWGRKAWGVYWVWDARLTSTLVLVLTLIATKIVRHYAGPSAKQVAAGLSVLAVLNGWFVWKAVDIWRGTHPEKLVSTLEPRMKLTFWICVLAFHLAFGALLWSRIRLAKLEDAVSELESRWALGAGR